jgi:hypothetical protein
MWPRSRIDVSGVSGQARHRSNEKIGDALASLVKPLHSNRCIDARQPTQQWRYLPAPRLYARDDRASADMTPPAVWSSYTPDRKGIHPHDICVFNKAVFRALKPGGHYVIVDHVACPDVSTNAPRMLHRIDPAVVRREVEAAGFEYGGEHDALRNPRDRHASSVFARGVRYPKRNNPCHRKTWPVDIRISII